MREIEFRGKALNRMGWVYGGIFTIADGVYIHEDGLCDEGFSVDPETVGQYTGIKDSQGVKIYEGDVVKKKTGEAILDGVFIVKWHGTGSIGFVLYDKSGSAHSLCDSDCPHLKVIGNIHDMAESPEMER
jgi:uncharacterized phage protein (TIGR01671 family)